MIAAAPLAGFAGCRVLVVEDEYLLAEDICQELQAAGAEVLGPASTVEGALGLLAHDGGPDVAILDVNLGGERSFPVADALRLRHVPFVFSTGYDAWALPAPYDQAPRCEKPVDMAAIGRALFG